jgi:hypothetical protein
MRVPTQGCGGAGAALTGQSATEIDRYAWASRSAVSSIMRRACWRSRKPSKSNASISPSSARGTPASRRAHRIWPWRTWSEEYRRYPEVGSTAAGLRIPRSS